MANFFIDLENGSDSNGGDSFAVTLTASDGVANGTSTYTSATGGFTGLTGRKIFIVTKGQFTIRVVNSDTNITLGNAANTTTATATAGSGLTHNVGGKWKTSTNGAAIAAADTVKVMQSPNPTLIGNATWSSPLQAGYNNPISVNITSSSSNVLTVPSGTRTTGDLYYVSSHTSNTLVNGTWPITVLTATTVSLDGCPAVGSGAATGTFKTANHTVVKLASSVNAHIDHVWATWTQSDSHFTSTLDTTNRKHGPSANLVTLTAGYATNTLLGYFATGTLDLSGYQQVSFWLKNSVALAATNFVLKLCTDTAGVTGVHTITLPFIPSTALYVPVVVDLSGALNSSIKSIALYSGSVAVGACTLTLNNIIACKASSSADSLNLTSLIGRNTTYEGWWTIRAIDGVNVLLEGVGLETAQSVGYCSTTNATTTLGLQETVSTYKRETIKPTMIASGTLLGFTASRIFSGGWDRVDMSTQTGMTWVDGQNFGSFNGVGTSGAGSSMDQFGITRCGGSVALLQGATNGTLECSGCLNGPNPTGGTFTLLKFTVMTGSGFQPGNFASGLVVSTLVLAATAFTPASNCSDIRIDQLIMYNCSAPISSNTAAGGVTFTNMDVRYSNTPVNLSFGCNGWRFLAGTMDRCNGAFGFAAGNFNHYVGPISITNGLGTPIIYHGTGMVFSGVTSTGGTGTTAVSYSSGPNYFLDCNFSETNKYVVSTALDSVVYCKNYQGVAGDHRQFWTTATGGTETTIRNTASGTSWRISPTSVARSSATPTPLALLPLACYAVNANGLVTVTVKAYRTSTTTLRGKLILLGGRLAGVPTDVSATTSGTAGNWNETLTVTCTPTEAGVLEVYGYAYDGTGITDSVYFDDMTFTQVGAPTSLKTMDYATYGAPYVSNEPGGGVLKTGFNGGMDG